MVSETTAVPTPGAPAATTEAGKSPTTKKNNNRRNRNRNNNRPANPNQNRRFNGNQNRKMTYQDFTAMAKHIESRTAYRPKMAIICGSGLGPLAAGLEEADEMPYETIPGFPQSTVEGHEGKLVFGKMAGVEVVAMKGRFHPYEGYPLWKVASPVRLFKCLGVKTILVSNAAGGLNPDYKVGDVMIIKDHINFLGFANMSPLSGKNIDEFGPRFPPISKAYTKNYRELAKKIFKECNNGDDSILREGVYCGLGGPTYETIAECKFLVAAGVDSVGMSTTQEVIAAAHCGINVLGVSLITNEAIMDYDNEEEANHEEVLATAKSREPLLTKFAVEFVKAIKDDLMQEDKED